MLVTVLFTGGSYLHSGRGCSKAGPIRKTFGESVDVKLQSLARKVQRRHGIEAIAGSSSIWRISLASRRQGFIQFDAKHLCSLQYRNIGLYSVEGNPYEIEFNAVCDF